MRTTLCTTLFLLTTKAATAGSLLGADLQYAHVEDLTWSFTVIAYHTPYALPETPYLFAAFDGDVADTIPVGSHELIPGMCTGQMYREFYTWQHDFPGPGVYGLKVWKDGRISEQFNLPVSPDNVLCLSTQILVAPGMVNASPVFGTPQHMYYFVGDVFTHDPLVTDPDGDSLSFASVVPQGMGCAPMSAFVEPALSTFAGDLTLLDPATGIFQWIEPNTSGMFCAPLKCTEWRNGVAIGSVTRDMTVCLETLQAVGDPVRNDLAILHPWLNGPVSIRWGEDEGYTIDVMDAQGALVHHARTNGPRTTLAVDGWMVGVYLVKLTRAKGVTASGRFVVGR